MKKRAQEEIEMVKEEMKRSADFYVREHSLLHAHLSRIRGDTQSRYAKGCINLLHHRILHCEITLSIFSKTFQAHISYEYPTCSLISAVHNCVDSDTDDVEDLSLSSSEDSSDGDSSSDSSAEE